MVIYMDSNRIKAIQMSINEFFISDDSFVQMLCNNLNILYKMADALISNLPEYKNDEGIKIDKTLIIEKTPLEVFEIVSDFYKKFNIDFDINKIIKDGTLDMIYSGYENFLKGSCFYENGKILIDVCSHDLITDSIILVHEISHYRNRDDKGRLTTSELLTETVAYAEEFVFIDYLYNNGYAYDANSFKNLMYNLCVKLAKEMKAVYKFGVLYKEMSSITIGNYEYYFGDSLEYNEEIETIDKYMKSGASPVKDTKYIVAFILATHLYQEYKKNASFINNIEALHSTINNKDLFSCLELMNLSDLGNKDFELLVESLQKTKLELEDINTRKLF